jgi:hypothetical protein
MCIHILIYMCSYTYMYAVILRGGQYSTALASNISGGTPSRLGSQGIYTCIYFVYICISLYSYVHHVL